LNRTLRGIIVALFFVVFLLLSGGRRFGVDSESLFLPVLILVFFGLIVTIWFAPEPQRRIGVWGDNAFCLVDLAGSPAQGDSDLSSLSPARCLGVEIFSPLCCAAYGRESCGDREDHYEKHSHLAGCYHIARDSLSVNSPDLLTR